MNPSTKRGKEFLAVPLMELTTSEPDKQKLAMSRTKQPRKVIAKTVGLVPSGSAQPVIWDKDARKICG